MALERGQIPSQGRLTAASTGCLQRNEALDTFVYAHAALHGLISMGLRLNEEVEGVAATPTGTDSAAAGVIRSAWMTTVT